MSNQVDLITGIADSKPSHKKVVMHVCIAQLSKQEVVK
jgi:hypothetical protein